ncbi:MAG: hypothetical protein NTV22_11710 [bacterium]|nr:hypothetical protein [bacterium]
MKKATLPARFAATAELMRGGGFDVMRAHAFAEMGHTNTACHHMLQACETRRQIVGDADIDTTAERRFLTPLLPNAAPLFRARHALLVSNQSARVAQASLADARDHYK